MQTHGSTRRSSPRGLGLGLLSLTLVTGCGHDLRRDEDFAGGSGGTAIDGTGGLPPDGGSDPASDESSTTDGMVDADSESGSGGPPLLDVGSRGSRCDPVDLDGIGTCNDVAPPDAFTPTVEWSLTHHPDSGVALGSGVIPLVGQFTDDDGDGAITLCDDPDVVVVAGPAPISSYGQLCSVFVIDGATGAIHYELTEDERVICSATPAFADIDGDDAPELVAMARVDDPPMWSAATYRLKAFDFDADGWSPKWTATEGGDLSYYKPRTSGSVALHDLDGDGDGEILYQHEVYDHEGNLLWDKHQPDPVQIETPTAVDLDGDGDLEVLFGHAVYHHDGTPIVELHPMVSGRALPHVADFDDDGAPEILLTTGDGLALVEPDGFVWWGPTTVLGLPAPPPDAWNVWMRPAAIADFDGDGRPEVAFSMTDADGDSGLPVGRYLLGSVDATGIEVEASWPITDVTGMAASTGFDFLGDGSAELIYGDETHLRVFDPQKPQPVLEQARCSGTLSEYPIVADVDNDGSAEILVVSNADCPAALQVFGEARSRWVGTRRIWNQHAYYVTNVLENGRLPATPIPNWETLNTFRTNAQLEGGGICTPEG